MLLYTKLFRPSQYVTQMRHKSKEHIYLEHYDNDVLLRSTTYLLKENYL